MLPKQIKRHRIQRRIRTRIVGTNERPRLTVFKSAKHIYAQLIDDDKAKVLCQVSDVKMKPKKGTKSVHALAVGKEIAKKALEKKIQKVFFDRGGFVFHGRVKAVADGAREGGLVF